MGNIHNCFTLLLFELALLSRCASRTRVAKSNERYSFKTQDKRCNNWINVTFDLNCELGLGRKRSICQALCYYRRKNNNEGFP